MKSILYLLLIFAIPPRLVVGQASAALAYTPSYTECPSDISLIRYTGTCNQSLSARESAYISTRQLTVIPNAWKFYLAAVQASTSNTTALPAYVVDILSGAHGPAFPTLAIANSGGGYRAAIVGAGILNALDARNSSSLSAGTGGLLQAASYIAGLSGGSWLVSSLAQANFPTLPHLVFGPPNASESAFGGWLAQFDFVEPSMDLDTTIAYLTDVVVEITGKLLAGFPVSLTDFWARILSRHFVNGTNAAGFFDPLLTHGAGITFSSIVETPSFAAYAQPFPIIVTDTSSPHGNASNFFNDSGIFVPLTNPIYEFNVFEMGTFDPMLGAFTPTKYLASPNNTLCVTGFDQASFIPAASSSIFNTVNLTGVISDSTIASVLTDLLSTILPQNGTGFDMALVPNPFFGVANGTYIDSSEPVLALVDGGEDGESLPLTPLLAKARGVDVIFAIDVAGNTEDSWADGSSMIATQDRVAFFPSIYSFPPLPTSQSTFLAQNLTRRPTFFGCNDTSASDAPLVIYIANGGPPLNQTPLTNTSTLQLAYSADQIDAMLSQSFDIATQGIPVTHNGHLEKDPEWPACLACAVVDRTRRQEGLDRDGICSGCMARYCWS
ncbi:hypothetical protein AcV5_002685 [Taiwanofungus camphoratus]|nr:hypothetical protein AcV5_002685 [Antrodia cinnamomea]